MSFASDAFAGNDGDTIETYSGNWTKIGSGSDLLINSGTIYASSNAAWSAHYWNAASPASADYDVQASVFRSSAGDVPGPAGRLVSANGNGYTVKYTSGTGWRLYRRNTTVAQIGSTYNGDDPLNSAKTVILRMVGTRISVLIEGVERIVDDGVDASPITAAGYAGLVTYFASAANSKWLDDWSATDSGSTGTGALSSGAATAEGAGTSSSTGTGALQAQSASVDGSGSSTSTGTGALAAASADVSGAGEVSWTGSGALIAQAADVTGEGTSGSTGTGALQAQSAASSGAGVSGSTGTGVLIAQASTITGVGDVSSAGSTVTFFRGVSKANGMANFQGISRPNIALADAGGGTYTVTKTHQPYSETPGSISETTYLIDGDLP